MALTDILAVLADEMQDVETAVKACVAGMLDANSEAAFTEQTDAYAEQLLRMSSVAEMLELDGLSLVAEFVQSNLDKLQLESDFNETKLEIFHTWPLLVIGYLRMPKEGIFSQELVEYLSLGHWPLPLDSEQAVVLSESLFAVTSMADAPGDPGKIRQSEAVSEDMDLSFPEDIRPQLKDAFITEGPGQAVEFSEYIQKFGTQGDGSLEDVDHIRRVIHNIKGSANTVGIRGVASFAHHVEDILDHCIDEAKIPQGDLLMLLIEVADIIELMFEEILSGQNNPPEHAVPVLQIVLDVANQIDKGEFEFETAASEPVASEPVVPEKSVVTEVHKEAVKVSPKAPAGLSVQPMKDPLGSYAKTLPKEEVKVSPKISVSIDAIDEMLRFSGEIAITRSHIQERLQESKSLLKDYRDRDANLWDRINRLEELVTTQGIEAVKHQTVTVEDGQAQQALDPLEMDQYSEMHTHVHLLAETVADLRILSRDIVDNLGEIDGSIREMTLLNNDIHQLIMTTRMVSADTLAHRLQRIVRQAANHADKNVRLVFEPNEVMLDDQMVNNLVDPLQHLLRNAVIHGLETSELRQQAGKSEQGTIHLRFERDGNYLNITCEDDGQGLDLMSIYNTALSKGLINQNDNISDTDMERLILQPGFSTATEVTEMAGRGVGMDVVNANVRKLKGNITITNRPSEGVKFMLRMPMTMGVVHCLVVKSHDQVYAVSVNNLNRVVHEGSSNIEFMSNEWFYREDGLTCPVYEMNGLVNGRRGGFNPDAGARPVIIVNDVNGPVAIVVDTVLIGRDFVIKNLGNFVGSMDGVLGTSILGDGQVVYILEISDLIEINKNVDQSTSAVPEQNRVEPVNTKTNEILIVDDSLSTRTALSLLMEENGFSVTTANDGLDAIEAIKRSKPVVMLVDMEMPNMDGLELTSHVRLRDDLKDIPIFMITSRTGSKHRTLAENAGVSAYLTKPYQESELLNLVDAALGVTA